MRGRDEHSGDACGGGGREKRDPEEPADHALGRSRGGFGTKLHLVTDGRGVPLAIHVTAGQVHESTQFEEVINAVRVPSRVGSRPIQPQRVAGDKGYSAGRIRDWLKQRAIEAVIPHRDDERRRDPEGTAVFDKETYRRRCVIEQSIGWLKESRAVATRYDKLALNYMATVQVAMIQRYLRLLVPRVQQTKRERNRTAVLVEAG